MAVVYRAERAVLAPGIDAFVVVDDDFEFHREACSYLANLRGSGSAFNTERLYAGRVALFLSYCSAAGLDWRHLTFNDLSEFLRSLTLTSYPSRAKTGGARRFRSSSTANAIFTAVTEFLKYASSQGWVEVALIEQLWTTKALRYRALGQVWGEDQQFRVVQARNLKLKSPMVVVNTLSDDSITSLVGAAAHERDRFLIRLMHDTGMRIGEVLGLRREDMHLLATSTRLGCSVPGPHIHVRRRLNANGAYAKSRLPRSIPVTTDLVTLYAAYQHERSEALTVDVSDFVFVNVFKQPLGAPMKYSNAKKLFDRLSTAAQIEARPHMLRHTAATRWLGNGTSRDVVQALLGHVSSASMEVYLHPTDAAKREAVERIEALRTQEPQ